ncbi:hypothetical protein [Pseudorhodoplanes sp.]|uniref:hypothetical protein n=1 Tax=Pseudorhodoplanes sp. TaxID=1934341 RepID=UPI00391D4AAB
MSTTSHLLGSSVRVKWRPITTAPLGRTILICDAHDRIVKAGTVILARDSGPSSERLVIASGYPVTPLAHWTHWAAMPPPPGGTA